MGVYQFLMMNLLRCIEFFAASKNADLLKSEFEKKIQKAKNEVLIFEAKLKVLNSSEPR